MCDTAFVRNLLVHELRSHLVSGVFLLLVGTSFVLTLFAVNAGIRQYDVTLQQQGLYQAEKEQLSSQPLMGWNAERALRVVRAPAEGSVLIRGLERSRVAFWDFSPSGLIDGPAPQTLDQRSESGLLFDYEAVVRILVGLLGMLLGVRCVASRRQDGTLQTLLDLPVSRTTVAGTQLVAVLVALAAGLASLWFGSVAVIWMVGPAQAPDNLHAAVMLISGAGWIYAGSLASVGMVVGSLSRTVGAAGSVGIGIWAFLALAYPQLATFTAHTFSPLPSHPAVARERSGMFDGRRNSTMEMLGRTAATLAEEQAAGGIVDLDRDPSARSILDGLWREDIRETRLLLRAIEDRADVAESRHDGLLAWLSAVSPSTTFTRAAADLADTGLASNARWQAAVSRYRQQLEVLLFDDPPRFTLPVPSGDGEQRVAIIQRAAPTANDLPRFEPPPDDLRTRLADAAPDLSVLAGYFALFAILAVATFPATGESRRAGRLG